MPAHRPKAIAELSICRNIKPLPHNDYKPTGAEIKAAAPQFVRKVSESCKPSRANPEAFDRAVTEIVLATRALLENIGNAQVLHSKATAH
jgi:hypothetical protein